MNQLSQNNQSTTCFSTSISSTLQTRRIEKLKLSSQKTTFKEANNNGIVNTTMN
jgi:hypothetical protein